MERLLSSPRLLGSKCRRGLDGTSARRPNTRFCCSACDREPALCDPHRRLRDSQRGWHSRGSLYIARRRLWADARDGHSTFAVETRTRSGDWIASSRRLAGGRGRPVMASPRPEVRCTPCGEDGSYVRRRIVAEALPVIYLARHGETAWSLSGQHTGRTDVPLTERGEAQRGASERGCRGLTFARVWTSPSRCVVPHLRAGGLWRFGRDQARPDGVGLRPVRGPTNRRDPRGACGLAAVSRRLPRRRVARGEIGARADRAVSRVRAVRGDVLLFSSAHFLRVFAARWLGLEAAGRCYCC